MEPLSLGALTAAALTEGIKFLYAQAADFLKRRRAREDAAAAEDDTIAPVPTPDGLLNGELQPIRIDFAALDRLASDIRQLRSALADVAQEIEPADPADQTMTDAADALRRALEAVSHQRITFAGEQRKSSGPIVDAEVNVGDVVGYVAGIRAKAVSGGQLRSRVTGGNVDAGGSVVGIDLGDIG